VPFPVGRGIEEVKIFCGQGTDALFLYDSFVDRERMTFPL
jgi:hypothetical protein